MENRILGLHHITAIAGNANRNLAFYTQVLGLRLVKKTVNFDDPSTYHFYFGNEEGTPGTILTFFPWEGIIKGTNGSGLATHIGYSVPKDSLEFWKNRLQQFHVDFEEGEIFGEKLISFQDPDGLQLQFIESSTPDDRKAWTTDEIKDENALKGFYNITLTLKNAAPTIKVLTDIFGYDLQKKEGERYRFVTNAIETANIVDIIENDEIQPGRNSAGTNHHVAFRVKDEQVLMEFREKVIAAGLNITTKIDRDYFYSLYFREPGGILFEIATDNPGFTVDEPLNELGTNLKLPKQHEPLRSKIEEVLPKLS